MKEGKGETDRGINGSDAAEGCCFGPSEKALAKAGGAGRKEAVITAKLGVGYQDKPNFRDSTRDRVMKSIEKSLRNLNSDYVDVYMVHWPDQNTPFEETMRALDDLVQQGKVRAVAISNSGLEQIETSIGTRRIDLVQYCWNLFDRRLHK